MRSTTTLMKNWQFTGPDGKTITVDLPHTWNNIDGQDGGNDYWRQWFYKWDAESGSHNLAARVTDGEGEVQTEERADPAPNGASGWHTVQFTVV